MNKYVPTQADWVRYCKEVLKRNEPLYSGFYAHTKDRQEWRNFRAWYRRQVKAS